MPKNHKTKKLEDIDLFEVGTEREREDGNWEALQWNLIYEDSSKSSPEICHNFRYDEYNPKPLTEELVNKDIVTCPDFRYDEYNPKPLTKEVVGLMELKTLVLDCDTNEFEIVDLVDYY